MIEAAAGRGDVQTIDGMREALNDFTMPAIRRATAALDACLREERSDPK